MLPAAALQLPWGRDEPQCKGDGQKKDSITRLDRKPLGVESTAHGEEVPRHDREVQGWN